MLLNEMNGQSISDDASAVGGESACGGVEDFVVLWRKEDNRVAWRRRGPMSKGGRKSGIKLAVRRETESAESQNGARGR
jgi:hypothetical protein